MAYELSYSGELAQVKDKAQSCVCVGGGGGFKSVRTSWHECLMTGNSNESIKEIIWTDGPSSNFENRVHDLVVSDLPSETKCSQFESGC